MINKRTFATLAAIGVLGAAAAVPALAQDDDAAVGAPPASVEGWREERHADFAAALAHELGLPAGEVEDALDAVREELRAERQAQRAEWRDQRLAEAVTSGALTQEQADALRAAAESGAFPLGRRGAEGARGARGGGVRHGGPDMPGAVPGGFGPGGL